ncbi:XdhC family protein [Streptomyces sp. XY006]|uniref:XdhC family protein n=1 Tax=Streptomyces sp. XY006 TaxID=2021410 RepID=UPI000B8C5EA8|nr:XdhC family protein [Streptomyces sp. XY006]OXS30900.1 hypothetical protein CHR28_34085 [Streptomyces sp. XY006]
MTGHNDVWDALYEAWSSGETSGPATVVRTFGSAPRPVGSSILNGRPQRAMYGISDDDAFGVGLTRGGTLEVFVEPVNTRTFPELAE